MSPKVISDHEKFIKDQDDRLVDEYLDSDEIYLLNKRALRGEISASELIGNWTMLNDAYLRELGKRLSKTYWDNEREEFMGELEQERKE